MRIAFIFYILLSFSLQKSFAQVPTQAELNKMMTEANELLKKYGNDSTVKKTGSKEKNSPAPVSGFPYEHVRLPPKKSRLIAMIPKKSLKEAEIKNMATTLYNQLKKNCGKAIVANAEKIVHTRPADELSQLAVLLWYNNSPEAATLLAVYAASQSQEGLVLNNCSAILNAAGLAPYAVSFLQYSLQQHPDNSLLLNNLGQAYFSLGETDSAQHYLMQCIRRSPMNPEANKTEAVIETAKGDKEAARKRIEEALQVSFTEEGKRILKYLDPSAYYHRFIKPRVKVPEYFNTYKFKLPPLCLNRGDVARAIAEVDAYQKSAEVLIKKYAAITAAHFKTQADNLMNIYEQRSSGNNSFSNISKTRPLQNTAAVILVNLEKEFNHRIGLIDKKYKQLDKDVTRLQKEHEIEFQKIIIDFADQQNEYSKSHEGPSEAISREECKTKNDLFNRYQLTYVDLAEKTIDQYYQVWADHINDICFWLYLGAVSKTQYHELFARYTAIFLARLQGLAGKSRPMFRYCDKDPLAATSREMSIKEPDCPVNLEITLVVGKINIDCEVFELELGEFALFGFEKNFKTGTTTIAFGAGISKGLFDLEFGSSKGETIPYSAMEFGAKQQFYITFDRDNSISDIGVLWEAEADIKGMNKPDAKVNMKLGMLSGTLEIDEGPLKPIADKIFGIQPETQLNNKVPIYKPD